MPQCIDNGVAVLVFIAIIVLIATMSWQYHQNKKVHKLYVEAVKDLDEAGREAADVYTIGVQVGMNIEARKERE